MKDKSLSIKIPSSEESIEFIKVVGGTYQTGPRETSKPSFPYLTLAFLLLFTVVLLQKVIFRSYRQKQKRNISIQTSLLLSIFTGISLYVYFLLSEYRLAFKSWDDISSYENLIVEKVALKDFYLSRFELTQSQFKAIVELNPFFNGIYPKSDKPYSDGCYRDAIVLCDLLSKATNMNFRLPSEWEWEMAARGGLDYRYSLGNNIKDLNSIAWYCENSRPGGPKSVGLKKATTNGFYDILGNVAELCMPTDISQVEENEIILRGGAYNSTAMKCRIFHREFIGRNQGRFGCGIRLLLEVKDSSSLEGVETVPALPGVESSKRKDSERAL